MSWLSKGLKKVGKAVKKGAKAVGKGWEKIDDFALPAIGFALGGPAGAALGSAAARGIGDGKFNAKETLLAGAKGYAGGQLAGAAGLKGGQGLKILGSSARQSIANPIASGKGVLGMGGGAPAAGQGAVPNLSIGADFAPSVTSATNATAAAGAAGGGRLDGLKKVGGFAMKNAQPILGGLAAYEGYKSDKRADQLNKQQLDMAMQNWSERAPLRKIGRDLMLDQSQPDLSYIYANSSNPFSRRAS